MRSGKPRVEFLRRHQQAADGLPPGGQLTESCDLPPGGKRTAAAQTAIEEIPPGVRPHRKICFLRTKVSVGPQGVV